MTKAALYISLPPNEHGHGEELRFEGELFGYPMSTTGELVFQTGMVGYVESLTDPSYARQFLTLTYPLIGNYGVPDLMLHDGDGLLEDFESERVWPAALIVNRLCPDGEHSNATAVRSLNEWLREAHVPGLQGVDTRRLTKIVREYGAVQAKLVLEADDPAALPYEDINRENLVAVVSRNHAETYGNGAIKVLAVDVGLKNNQLRCLLARGCTVKVVPHDYAFDEEKDNDYDGVFLSNGPGDPSTCDYVTERLRKLMARSDAKPVFGICMGHQLLAKAAGAGTYKL
ncbi:CBN-PYR-1 protein, partial [Aphelenchoides avenae]